MLRAVKLGLSIGEYAVARVARQALNLIGSDQPICPETAQWAAVALTATIRLAECRGEDSGELRAALTKLEGLRNGKSGPKLVCMCAPCVTHRAADLRWHNSRRQQWLKQNREYMRRKKAERLAAGGAEEKLYLVRPGEPSDEELDRRALEFLRTEGFR